jgi:hypothetical protein
MKRAVFIGINYTLSPPNRLAGCANDVRSMAALFDSFETRTLSDDIPGATWPSKRNILDALTWLVGSLRFADEAVLHYSGHGGLTVDVSGDEETGSDSCIYPISETGAVECITDDELRALIVPRVPRGAMCTVVFDCCHSGTCLDLRYGYRPISDSELVVAESGRYPRGIGTVLFLSGCADNETAAESVAAQPQGPLRVSGALTNALIAALATETKMKRVLWATRRNLRAGGFVQVPQLSSSVPFGLSSPMFRTVRVPPQTQAGQGT